MPIKYIPFIPEPVEGQAVLGNFNRILRYKGADELSMTLQRGMPLYEMEKQETVGENKDGNLVIRGECVSACAYLKEQGIQVDLVYIDPPFASGADYAKKVYLRCNPKVAEAIDREDPALLKEELGDLLLQVVFHADIERQAGDFTMDDVADGEVRKMLFRHPHVFGGQETVQDADTVLEGWEAIKRREKGQQTTAQALDAVARSLPGLWRAEKLQSKAARDGFDWPDISGALDKLDEEVSELHRAAAGDGDVTEELGDVLFAAVKVGRFVGVDPEVAIHGTCEKFIRRYRAVEEGAAAMGRSVDQLPLETLEALWAEAKGS